MPHRPLNIFSQLFSKHDVISLPFASRCEFPLIKSIFNREKYCNIKQIQIEQNDGLSFLLSISKYKHSNGLRENKWQGLSFRVLLTPQVFKLSQQLSICIR